MFIIARHWEKLERPYIAERLITLWYISTVKYYTAVKEKEKEFCELIGSDFGDILLPEKHKAQ